MNLMARLPEVAAFIYRRFDELFFFYFAGAYENPSDA
jgi:hypothetical protein